MAKKPKKGAAPTEEGEGAAEAPAPSGSKKKLILFAALGVLALGGAGGGYMFFAKGKAKGPEAERAEKKPVAFLDIKEMTVNLAAEPNQERQRFLKFRVSLELKDAKIAPEIQPLLPRVEDTFQVFVRELRPSDLEGSSGVFRLREELLRRVNIAVHPARVDAVLFKELVVQ